MKVLFGFRQVETETKIRGILKKNGIDIECIERETKASIKAYLEEHTDCNVAVLREGMEHETFSSAELAELTDTRDINIIVITDKSNKGTEFLETLYAAGITSAILVDKKNGASTGQIAGLIMNKRNRRSARLYYGMKNHRVNLDVLSYENFVNYYTMLINEDRGINVVDRFLFIVNQLTAKQTADFLKRIPKDLIKKLATYQEFFMVIDSLQKDGIAIEVRRPEKLRKGLSDEEFTRALMGESKRTSKSQQASEPADSELRENFFYNAEEESSEEESGNNREVDEKEEKPSPELNKEEVSKKRRRNPWKIIAYAAISLLLIGCASFIVYMKYSAF